MRIAVAGGTGAVGRHTVAVLRERGHEPVVLSRSTGVDLVSGSGLDAALAGADAVVDLASVQTQSAAAATTFFEAVSRNLLAAGKAAGVRHHVALGIVGSDAAPYGYYAGKMAQEHLVENGPLPWTILRATQFHEFAAQIYGRIKLGPVVLVPAMQSQPIAAREVAERLAGLATGVPAGRVRNLAGPEVLSMPAMVRSYAKVTGRNGPVLGFPLPGAFGRALRNGTLLAGADADRGRQTFTAWLELQPNPRG